MTTQTATVAFIRKVRCPRHYLKHCGRDPFVRELDPLLKNVSDFVVKKYGVKKYRIKKDKCGNPILNFEAFMQPPISASFAIEHVWDPKNPICVNDCRGRCMRGKGPINERSIKRLSGGA
jgi:hypothetical protein